MHWRVIVLSIILCACFVYLFCLVSRVFRVHHGAGTFVLLRKKGTHRWLHTRILYTPEGLRYITHSCTLKSGIIDRTSIELLPQLHHERNLLVMPIGAVASCELKTQSFSCEIASTLDTVTALQSWVESCPSIRQVPRPTWMHDTKSYSHNKI